MSKDKKYSLYIIRHKTTGEVFRAPSGKTSWRAANHAKAAFARIHRWQCESYGLPLIAERISPRAPKFDEQDVYELVELVGTAEDRLKQAEDLLEHVYALKPDLPTELARLIKEFLKIEE
jgi:hypothetical protein